jgi:hypothetical protein
MNEGEGSFSPERVRRMLFTKRANAINALSGAGIGDLMLELSCDETL